MVLGWIINNLNKSMQRRSSQLMMQLTLYADDFLCPLFFNSSMSILIFEFLYLSFHN